ncbi:nuclease-related domain-containing protein [Ferrimonas balearica]|uniref:nuclease-related domain-containing protein n=1 Tax=Ferrimonas balearica TaxID=44012 RepID=UPI001C99708C|nr:nuclease-related domain-containing protein [Ferrimonas balearica]MBY5922069.1 NERD domain-containing protein [Ferrimonas balearica]MBY5994591.1 NERD domain-containing protein [Ferrimonas balearica]
MILKDKDVSNSSNTSIQAQFGAQHEKDVAFFLRRAYAENPNVFVINDFRFEHRGDVSQIDHLLIYKHGFILIESKSIHGEVRVNQSGEWSRSYKGHWKGMPSPVQQLELQQQALRKLLNDHAGEILPKKLFGLMQQSFGARRYENICAVSSSALLHRDTMPNRISSMVVKCEFLADSLKGITDIGAVTSFVKTLPDFSEEELKAICDFLMAQHQTMTSSVVTEPTPQAPNPLKLQAQAVPQTLNTTEAPPHSQPIETEPKIRGIACKKCGETQALSGNWGRYGYYVKCCNCDTNTAMKQLCPACRSSNTKISKRGVRYTSTCHDCQHQVVVFQGKEPVA